MPRLSKKSALAGEAITDEQIDALASALVVAADSHATLMAQRQAAAAATGGNGIDSMAVFADLQAAVAAFDPGATDLIDQLITGQEEGGELAVKLAQARELLDNFNFGDAQPLLAEIGEGLQA